MLSKKPEHSILEEECKRKYSLELKNTYNVPVIAEIYFYTEKTSYVMYIMLQSCDYFCLQYFDVNLLDITHYITQIISE